MPLQQSCTCVVGNHVQCVQEKSKESVNKMQDMTQQLQSLQLENERLQSQNRTLQLASLCQKVVTPEADAQVRCVFKDCTSAHA